MINQALIRCLRAIFYTINWTEKGIKRVAQSGGPVAQQSEQHGTPDWRPPYA